MFARGERCRYDDFMQGDDARPRDFEPLTAECRRYLEEFRDQCRRGDLPGSEELIGILDRTLNDIPLAKLTEAVAPPVKPALPAA